MSAVQEAIGEARGTIGIPPGLRRVVDAVVRRFQPARVILYGSRARGDAKPDSDWDLLVALETEAKADDARFFIHEIGWNGARVHYAVFSTRQMVTELNEPSNLGRHVARDGIVLYAAGEGALCRPVGAEDGLDPAGSRQRRTTVKQSTRKWLNLAQDDLGGARRLHEPPHPLPRLVVFHCQQCAEKCLKALLEERDIEFEKTHDLEALLGLVAPPDPDLVSWRADFEFLNPFAVGARYGLGVNQRQVRRALKVAAKVLDRVTVLIGAKPAGSAPESAEKKAP
ncbi:MAG: HEPN domain-containing protein [Planctomycetes bacterium]|nr:HEPN domain-containing protein [Planctomycetota bacterium]